MPDKESEQYDRVCRVRFDRLEKLAEERLLLLLKIDSHIRGNGAHPGIIERLRIIEVWKNELIGLRDEARRDWRATLINAVGKLIFFAAVFIAGLVWNKIVN